MVNANLRSQPTLEGELMGWGYCGQDDLGRDIGYSVEATCDFEGCEEKIDRGLGYCCGSMHNGDDNNGCGRYFCGVHQWEGEHGHKCPTRVAYFDRLVEKSDNEGNNDNG